jgi:excisionase family DNA binding protein
MPGEASSTTNPVRESEPTRRVTFQRRGVAHEAPRLAVPIDEAAAMLGVSYMTLWRAIRENQFPGVRLRDRILVPLKAVDLLLESAIQSGELIDTPVWTQHWRADLAGTNAGAS